MGLDDWLHCRDTDPPPWDMKWTEKCRREREAARWRLIEELAGMWTPRETVPTTNKANP